MTDPNDPTFVRRNPLARPDIAQPERIGHLRIIGPLGAGGMGVVHEALDERLGRRVALKSLARNLHADPAARARLEREARAAAALNHPGIVTLYSLEDADDALYLCFELVEGTTLRKRVPAGGLPAATLLDWAVQLADAVAAAHAAGIVHRDLKPANVMVTPHGRIKVLDFGIAAMHDALDPARQELLTQEGDVLGTPGYMSPEQLGGRPADARADTWALGVVMHEMATGGRAFEGATPAALAASILRDDPPSLGHARADLPEGLDAILMRCLEKDPARRFADAAELRDALVALGSERRATPVRATPGRHSLPAERDAFVGRSEELAGLSRLLDPDTGHRLVSVLGLGGTGKTRLVVRHAWASLDRFPGGAWFCDLSEARSVDGLASAVAHALGVPLGKDDPVIQLGHAIAGRGRCLVILDNFEQVARHATETLGRWLDRCAEASFVVTTRELLGLRGEQVMALAPLTQADAEALFLERAQATRHDFAPQGSEREELSHLVTMLDLLPLAIELAAARVTVMPPSKIRARLSDRFALLTSTGRRHDRQATLRATLDWSWDLLEEWEKSALAQLSVFEGGFTLEASEAVLDLAAWPQAPLVMDVVQGLLQRSLVRHATEDRFDLLVTVQEYAAEKLRADGSVEGSGVGAELSARRRHGAYFASFGTDAALAALSIHGGVERQRRLAAEIENLVAACRRATTSDDATMAVNTLMAAGAVLARRGPFVAWADSCAKVLAVHGLEAADRATALRSLATALTHCGRMDEALGHYEAALTIYRELGDRRGEGKALEGMGIREMHHGTTDKARAFLEAALAIHREVGNRGGEGIVLGYLGSAEEQAGRVDEACATMEAALVIVREVGDRVAEGNAVANLGVAYFMKGRHDEARALYEIGLAIHREVGNRAGEGIVVGHMGNLHFDVGRLDEARAHYDAALAIHREVGHRASEAICLAAIGSVLKEQGHVGEARSRLEAALAIDRETGSGRNAAITLLNLGELHLHEGRMEDALACFDASVALVRELGSELLEAAGLGLLGLVHAREGRFAEARAALCEGETLLHAGDARLDLSTLLSLRAEAEHLAGDHEAALAALAQAERLAAELAPSPESQLGRELARVRALIDGGAR